MKRTSVMVMMSMACLFSSVAAAQQAAASGTPAAGKSAMGVPSLQMEAVRAGWSAKRDLLGKRVSNDKQEKIGNIDDIILMPAPDAKAPFAAIAIIGVGGFLGINKYDVAIPMEQIKLQEGSLVLPGSTKEALKALPKFERVRK